MALPSDYGIAARYWMYKDGPFKDAPDAVTELTNMHKYFAAKGVEIDPSFYDYFAAQPYSKKARSGIEVSDPASREEARNAALEAKAAVGDDGYDAKLAVDLNSNAKRNKLKPFSLSKEDVLKAYWGATSHDRAATRMRKDPQLTPDMEAAEYARWVTGKNPDSSTNYDPSKHPEGFRKSGWADGSETEEDKWNKAATQPNLSQTGTETEAPASDVAPATTAPPSATAPRTRTRTRRRTPTGSNTQPGASGADISAPLADTRRDDSSWIGQAIQQLDPQYGKNPYAGYITSNSYWNSSSPSSQQSLASAPAPQTNETPAPAPAPIPNGGQAQGQSAGKGLTDQSGNNSLLALLGAGLLGYGAYKYGRSR